MKLALFPSSTAMKYPGAPSSLLKQTKLNEGAFFPPSLISSDHMAEGTAEHGLVPAKGSCQRPS